MGYKSFLPVFRLWRSRKQTSIFQTFGINDLKPQMLLLANQYAHFINQLLCWDYHRLYFLSCRFKDTVVVGFFSHRLQLRTYTTFRLCHNPCFDIMLTIQSHDTFVRPNLVMIFYEHGRYRMEQCIIQSVGDHIPKS